MPRRDLYGSHNAELTAAAKRHSDLQILDWDGFTANQPDWFASDGIHLNLVGADGLANFIKNALDAQPAIGRCRASRALTGTPDTGVSTTTVPPTDGSGFVPLVPKRVLDTRDPALGGAAGKLGTGRTVSIDVGRHRADRRGRHGLERHRNGQLLRRLPHGLRLWSAPIDIEHQLRSRAHDRGRGDHTDDRRQVVRVCVGGHRRGRRRDGCVHPRR